MALKAKLHINDSPQTYSIVECEYDITQPVNPDGQPCGGVIAGRIVITIVSPEKAQTLQEWMLNDHMQHDGFIEMDVNYNYIGRNACRIIQFKNAYCIGLYEYFNNQSSKTATMRITIYAENISFQNETAGNAIGYDNIEKKSME